jgi:hypothetical protein
VCISCIVIPLCLWLWHRFLQPIFLKLYNPWQKVENKEGTEIVAAEKITTVSTTAPPAKCPISAFMNKEPAVANENSKKED